MIQSFLRHRILRPVFNLLLQGITPEKIALSIAVGFALGIFPVIGATTVLCFLAAFLFSLNLPSLQLVNVLAYPMQLLLMIPFIRAGEILFRASKLSLSLPKIEAMVRTGIGPAIQALWEATIHAIVVWAIVAPVIIFPVYKVLVLLLRKVAAKRRLRNPKTTNPIAIEE